MKILYKYSVSLDYFQKVAHYELREYKIRIDKETDKQIEFFDGRSRKLKKEKLKKVDTIFHEKCYDFMSYFIYCWEEDSIEAKEILLKQIDKAIINRIEALDKLKEAHKQGYVFKEMKQNDY